MTTLNAGKDAEKLGLSHIAGGDVKQYGHSGRSYINTFSLGFYSPQVLVCLSAFTNPGVA